MYVSFLSNIIPSSQCTEPMRTTDNTHTPTDLTGYKHSLYILWCASHVLLWMCVQLLFSLFIRYTTPDQTVSPNDASPRTCNARWWPAEGDCTNPFEESRCADWIDCNYLVMMSYRYIGFSHNCTHIRCTRIGDGCGHVTKNWDKEAGIQRMCY